MVDLTTLYRTIDQLNADDLRAVQQYIEQRRQQTAIEETAIEARIAALHAAVARFREGFTPEEWDEVAAAMNEEYVDPDDANPFEWLDDEPGVDP